MKGIKIKFFCGMLFTLGISLAINAQVKKNNLTRNKIEHCLTMDALEKRLKNDQAYQSFYRNAYQISKVSKQAQKRMVMDDIVVPVAFHFAPNVVNCNDLACILAEVQDQMDALNEAFADNTGTSAEAICPSAYQDANGNSVASTGSGISFCYATPPQNNAQGLDPICDPPITLGAFTGGASIGGLGAPGWEGILNIFITPDDCLGISDGIPGAADGDGVTVCAAAFGGQSPTSGCGLDTEVYYGLGKTLTHEVGHYLGLFHTFEGGCSDEPNSAGPYNVNDTPAIAEDTAGCPSTCVNGGCGSNVAFANFMDYSDDACLTMFTQDQVLVMNYWANQLFGNTSSACSGSNSTALTALCDNQPCVSVCPTNVVTSINIQNDFCGSTGNLNFPNPIANGLILNADSNDPKFVWSVNGYLSANGTPINNPAIVNSSLCSVNAQTYYLNIDCNSTPLTNLLQGGIYTIRVYPNRPNDLTNLISITNENTCIEPIITPLPGCQNYIGITPNSSNVSFPVNSGDMGIVSYELEYLPNANGPDCCTTTDTEGEIIENGNFEMDVANWIETEEVPVGTPNPNPFGIIGVSDNLSIYGSIDAWFGGWQQSSYTAIEKTIIIPVCDELALSFDYATFSCSNFGNTILNVIIGNVTVATVFCESSGYSINNFGPINVKSFNVPIGEQVLKLEAIETGISGGSIIVDNLSLISSACTKPVDCNEEITLNYNCNCDNSLNFNNTHQVSVSFHAGVSIESSAIVNATVHYKAGTRITLNSGFSTQVPNQFSAYIEACF